MKLLPTFKYLTRDIMMLSLPIYYGVLLCITFTTEVFVRLGRIPDGFIVVNLGMNSTIMLIVIGLMLTKTELNMLAQLGVSRKTTMLAKGGAILVVTIFLTFADYLMDLYSRYVLSDFIFRFNFLGDLERLMYLDFIESASAFQKESALLMLGFVIRLAIFVGAVFLSILFIRMNKIAKAVFILSGIVLMTTSPILLYSFPKFRDIIVNTLAFSLGIQHQNPLIAFIFFLVICFILYSFYVLTIRRAPAIK